MLYKGKRTGRELTDEEQPTWEEVARLRAAIIKATDELEAAHVETLETREGHLEAGTVVCLSCQWPKHGDHAPYCEWNVLLEAADMMDPKEPTDDDA